MKEEWKPYSQVIGGKWVYIAGRQKDVSKPLGGGNIEHKGEYEENRQKVLDLCKKLNEQ